MSKKRWNRWFIMIPIALLATFIGGILFLQAWVMFSAQPYIYENVKDVPARDVGVVLGTSKYVSGKRMNLFFHWRMRAAADLYHAGKVKRLLLSGSNPSEHYNEPQDMYLTLHELGVPKEDMEMDFAGFRTLDSMVRAKEVFGQEEFTVITNRFHTYRSVFLGRNSGADVIAFSAQDVPLRYSLRTVLREKIAIVKAVLDLYVFHTKPKFLGDPVPIPSEETGAAVSSINHET